MDANRRLTDRLEQLERALQSRAPTLDDAPSTQNDGLDQGSGSFLPQQTSTKDLDRDNPFVTTDPLTVPTPVVQKPFDFASGPDLWDRLIKKIKDYVTKGNPFVSIGVILIFLGVGFLLKYAVDKRLISIELRLVAAALFGVLFVHIGWKLARKNRHYGLIVQGGGIGIMILTTFVSFRFYQLISPLFAFLLLAGYTVLAAFLAIYQNSQALAAFGFLGGFLAPILVSTGKGNHIHLFSYYAVLNLGILCVALKKTWRELNVIGFFATFVISGIWAAMKYRTDFYWSTQPFLILYFLIYSLIPVVFASRKTPELRGYVDGTLVFGTAICTLLLQLRLVHDIEYAGSVSALFLAAFYVFLSHYLVAQKKQNYRLLGEAYVSIGIVFITTAVPLAFDGLKTSAIWALEAAGIYWVSMRQNRILGRYAAVLLLMGSSVAFVLGPVRGEADYLFLNAYFLGCIMMAGASYVISFCSQRDTYKSSAVGSLITNLTFILGSLWWSFGGYYEVDRFVRAYWSSQSVDSPISKLPPLLPLNANLLYFSLASLGLYMIGRHWSWSRLRRLSTVLCLFLLFGVLAVLSVESQPLANYGYFAWSIAALTSYGILFLNDDWSKDQLGWILRLCHVCTIGSLVAVSTMELDFWLRTYMGQSSAWRHAGMGLISSFVAWVIMRHRNLLSWPVQRHLETYLKYALLPIMLGLWLWLLCTSWLHNGSASPIPYIVLINPLELMHSIALVQIGFWMFLLFRSVHVLRDVDQRLFRIFWGATGLVWLNGVLARAIHHYMGVSFRFSSMFWSVEAQAVFSIFWTIIGLAAMMFATSKKYRWLWISGAVVLAVIVMKMLFIDLSKTQTIARVISFIGVGLLLLVVGYFSPIPPKLNDNKEKLI